MALCAGMGTTIVVTEALRRGLAQHGLNSVSQCVVLTELNEAKRNALRRRLACVIGNAPTPSIYIDNASLSLTPVLDEHSNVVDRPIADFLFRHCVRGDVTDDIYTQIPN